MFRHPEPGDVIGGYRLLNLLGDGSFGLVFKAERGGRFFALKFLHDADFGTRARREVAILAEMENPCVVRFHGFERWPEPILGTPYIVMDFVDGLTLEAHAAAHNPSARKATSFTFQLGLTLGEVHRRGVLHRDLKPTNILITTRGEVPVLIDFGVGWHVGAPLATEEGSLPGTLEFQAPEALQCVGRHEYHPSDDLWALGVCFYWLLTDILPFGDRQDAGFIERVLHMKPVPPHVLNPRVPETLSTLCMRMLEKRPEDRFGGALELCTALNEALIQTARDPSWDLPLFDSDESGTRETSAGLDESDSMRWIHRWLKESPRRGWKPTPGVGAIAVKEDGNAAAREPEAVAASVAPAILAPEDAPVAAAPLPQPSRPGRWAPALRQGPVWPVGPLVLDLLKRHAVALMVAIAAVFLIWVGTVGLSWWPAPTPEGKTTLTMMEDATKQTGRVREVAWPDNPPEAGRSAAPVGASTPAPNSTTMLRNHKSRSKAEKKPTPQSQPEAPNCVPVSRWLCTAAGVCSLVLTGCPGVQVRPATPAVEPCPPDAVKIMKEQLGINVGAGTTVSLTHHPGGTIVRGGETAAAPLGQRLGQLPPDTVLYGRYIIAENRVYGRFTLARRPNGDTFPVCVQISDVGGQGVEAENKDGDTAEIPNAFDVIAVPRFANTADELWRRD